MLKINSCLKMHDQTNWKTESEIICIKNNNAWGPNKTNQNTDYKNAKVLYDLGKQQHDSFINYAKLKNKNIL